MSYVPEAATDERDEILAAILRIEAKLEHAVAIVNALDSVLHRLAETLTEICDDEQASHSPVVDHDDGPGGG